MRHSDFSHSRKNKSAIGGNLKHRGLNGRPGENWPEGYGLQPVGQFNKIIAGFSPGGNALSVLLLTQRPAIAPVR
jgi:hypothetical protein